MAAPLDTALPGDLLERLATLTLRDEHRLRRRVDQAARTREPARRAALLERVTADVVSAEGRVARRRAAVPAISYPDLPVTAAREELLAALGTSQVVVVAGETGSGKTTQLPKMLLELGRGVRGTIGHTQPRRIAARTVAERIAEELGVPLGGPVGWKVRFTDQVGETTLVKLMTDGVLLAELQHDRDLRQYDTIVIDEAHERSLNVDFLLGYLARLLPRRPDLQVVVTSATIDPQRFAEHFGGAPVVEVSGRTYPVQVRYRPLEEAVDDGADGEADDATEVRDVVTAIGEAVVELQRAGPGDVLVFLSGEREIRDAADALKRLDLAGTEVLPLYGRLSAAEQHRAFEPSSAYRRVVLATNVAETSLTVPGIRYVVDTGTARISRYSNRLKVQRLPIEPVSQASAHQRAGRCGRVADGICIRLYSEEDFSSRPQFTDPEILRTSLAAVILQMAALGLGDVAAFPFLDPPDRRQIRDGVQLLEELGALEPTGDGHRLTDTGRRLAQLPLDPRFARMVVQGDADGCLREVLVIAAALSIQDPRERPTDALTQAQQSHARFKDEHSDLQAYLNLWAHVREQQQELSSSAFRRMCKREHLHYLRIREWQDLHGQLRRIVEGLGMRLNETPAEGPRVTQALLAGLLSHVGFRDGDKRDYTGARGARFVVAPGSALHRGAARWVVAAELVETNRLYARDVARVEPEWVERLAGHLVKRTFSEPHWERRRGSVVAYEKVTLYGLPLVTRRKVSYGSIDPEVSRDLFLRHALVEGDWQTNHRVLTANRELLEDLADLEHRVRRRGLTADDEVLYAFYDERLPADVVSGRHFDSWWKRERHLRPDLLTLTATQLLPDGVDAAGFPDTWDGLPLSYLFEPGNAGDGVTLDVPLAALPRLDADALAWHVPGLRLDLVTALLRGLPKEHRVAIGPAPDAAAAVLRNVHPGAEPLLPALEREVLRHCGVAVPRDAWSVGSLPPHLRVNVRVLDGPQVVDQDRDVALLRGRLRPQLRQLLARAAATLERSGLRGWDVGTVPQTFERDGLLGHPALVDEGSTVALRVLGSAAEQRRAHWAGVRRLLRLASADPTRSVHARLSTPTKLALLQAPHGSATALFDDATTAALDAALLDAGGPPWDAEAYAALLATVRAGLTDRVHAIVVLLAEVVAEAAAVRERLDTLAPTAAARASLDDVRAQVQWLARPGLATAHGAARLPDVVRYLRAAQVRLDALPRDPARDRLRMAEVHRVQEEWATASGRAPHSPVVARTRWLVEELRVSLFAQKLGTPQPVSEARILRALDDLTP